MGSYELINAVKMRLSKQMALNAEVSFDTSFRQELGLFGVSFGSLVTKFKRRIATGAFRFEEICYITP